MIKLPELMKALTLYNPWAMLAALKEKKNETRSWYTKYRGLLAIHVGATNFTEFGKTTPFWNALSRHGLHYATLPSKAIIAVCTLADCLYIACDGLCQYDPKGKTKIGEIVMPLPIGNELAFGDYRPGRFAWILSDVRQLATPIPAKGKQGLWNVPPEIQKQIRKELSA